MSKRKKGVDAHTIAVNYKCLAIKKAEAIKYLKDEYWIDWQEFNRVCGTRMHPSHLKYHLEHGSRKTLWNLRKYYRYLLQKAKAEGR